MVVAFLKNEGVNILFNLNAICKATKCQCVPSCTTGIIVRRRTEEHKDNRKRMDRIPGRALWGWRVGEVMLLGV